MVARLVIAINHTGRSNTPATIAWYGDNWFGHNMRGAILLSIRHLYIMISPRKGAVDND